MSTFDKVMVFFLTFLVNIALGPTLAAGLSMFWEIFILIIIDILIWLIFEILADLFGGT